MRTLDCCELDAVSGGDGLVLGVGEVNVSAPAQPLPFSITIAPRVPVIDLIPPSGGMTVSVPDTIIKKP